MALRRNVLVVEDEADLARLIRFHLEREGYVCRCATDGETAMAEVRRQRPDLIVLDRMLPRVSGDDVAAHLRREPKTASIPIIFLTAKAEESDELVGFALGADDYISKPFSVKALLARVTAVLRRVDDRGALPHRISSGPFTLDVGRHEVTVHEKQVSLTATEFRLLQALMASDGRVMSRSQLIDAALGTDAIVTDRTIDVHVTALRKKLGVPVGPGEGELGSTWIQTVRGVGYTFRSPS
jgi:two-component system phosphate regulon response regulator PhoB